MFIRANDSWRASEASHEAHPEGLPKSRLLKAALAIAVVCLLSACASGSNPHQAIDRPGSEEIVVMSSQTGRFVLRVEDPSGSTRGAQGGFELLRTRSLATNSLGTQLHLYGPMNHSLGSLEQVGDQLMARDGRGRNLSPTELTHQLNTLLGQADWLSPLMAMDLATRLLRHVKASEVSSQDSARAPSETEFTIGVLRLSLRTVHD